MKVHSEFKLNLKASEGVNCKFQVDLHNEQNTMSELCD